jgi:hypothetical protein
MSVFHCIGLTRVRQSSGHRYPFRNKATFYNAELLAPRPTPKLEVTPCLLSATTYSIYSQLPSILKAVPPSATWGRAMPWWQRSTYHAAHRSI